MKKTVVIGVTGSIAAIKIPELVRQLQKKNIEIILLLTRSASRIISQKDFPSSIRDSVHNELFPSSYSTDLTLRSKNVDHITIARKANLYVVAPATANCLAKLAHGIADDYVTTTALAVRSPVVLFPAMNTVMWMHPATQKSVTTCRELGYIVFEPSQGELACGEEGIGRLMPVKKITDIIVSQLSSNNIVQGKTIVITSGGTMEQIDKVRYITNKSSGKTGVAIAEECYRKGADVILLRSPSSKIPRYPIRQYEFTTVKELDTLIKTHCKNASVCIHAAAVSDFSVAHPFSGKTSSANPLPLELTPTTKILDKIKTYNPHVYLVAFKAEWNVTDKELVRLSKKRLSESHADLIVANDVSRKGGGFNSDSNNVSIIDSSGHVTHVALQRKEMIARIIVTKILKNIQ